MSLLSSIVNLVTFVTSRLMFNLVQNKQSCYFHCGTSSADTWLRDLLDVTTFLNHFRSRINNESYILSNELLTKELLIENLEHYGLKIQQLLVLVQTIHTTS
jgi:hypothetical protein